jgi:uncharacterized membrane protein YhhN
MVKLNRFDKLIYSLFALAVVSFLILLIPFHPYPFSFVLKAIPLSCLIILVWRYTEGFNRAIIILALLFSLAGDITLDIDRSRFFILGLVFFLISHIFYIVLLVKHFKWQKNRILPFALVILYAVVLTVILKDIDPSRLPAVMAYLLIISVMTAVAFMYKPTEEKKSFVLIPIGAVIFMLSDSIIAVNQFLRPIPHSLIYSLTLYFTAQMLITGGFILKEKYN